MSANSYLVVACILKSQGVVHILLSLSNNVHPMGTKQQWWGNNLYSCPPQNEIDSYHLSSWTDCDDMIFFSLWYFSFVVSSIHVIPWRLRAGHEFAFGTWQPFTYLQKMEPFTPNPNLPIHGHSGVMLFFKCFCWFGVTDISGKQYSLYRISAMQWPTPVHQKINLTFKLYEGDRLYPPLCFNCYCLFLFSVSLSLAVSLFLSIFLSWFV